ncbi:MAG: GNAT family N-acetyltransferase [Firmicutes bacterium]|nr:GNAT family N-acetyltransferase [Bacillota bacterium]
MNTIDKQKALEFLNKDFLSFAPMIEALEKNEAQILSIHDYGIALMHNEGIMLLGLINDKAILHYKDKINEGLLTVVYGNSDPDYLTKIIPNIARVVACHQVVYTKKLPPSIKHRAQYKLLNEKHLDFVFDNYSRAWNKDHMKKLLNRGLIWGAYLNDEIIGFVGRHSEGSMGLLEILPKFRRQGFGKELEYFIIEKVFSEGKIPYAHIVIGNDVSMDLQTKIDGLEIASKLATWIRVET